MVEASANHEAKGADIERGHGELADDGGAHGNDRLDRPKIMADRVDESQAAELFRMSNGKNLRNSTAYIMANKMYRGDP